MKSLKDTCIEEFREKFTYHPYGVSEGGSIKNPDYIPLTIKNVESFLSTTIDRVLEAAKGCVPEVGMSYASENGAIHEAEIDKGYNDCRSETLERLEALIQEHLEKIATK